MKDKLRASQELHSYIGSPGCISGQDMMQNGPNRRLSKEDLSTSPLKLSLTLKNQTGKQYNTESPLASKTSTLLEGILRTLADIAQQLERKQTLCSQLELEKAKSTNMLKFIESINKETAKV